MLTEPLRNFVIYCKTDCVDIFKSEVDTNDWSIKITTRITEHFSVANHLLVMYKATKKLIIQICRLDSKIFLISSGDIINVKQVIIGPVIFSALSLPPDSSDESDFHICH